MDWRHPLCLFSDCKFKLNLKMITILFSYYPLRPSQPKSSLLMPTKAFLLLTSYANKRIYLGVFVWFYHFHSFFPSQWESCLEKHLWIWQLLVIEKIITCDHPNLTVQYVFEDTSTSKQTTAVWLSIWKETRLSCWALTNRTVAGHLEPN